MFYDKKMKMALLNIQYSILMIDFRFCLTLLFSNILIATSSQHEQENTPIILDQSEKEVERCDPLGWRYLNKE